MPAKLNSNSKLRECYENFYNSWKTYKVQYMKMQLPSQLIRTKYQNNYSTSYFFVIDPNHLFDRLLDKQMVMCPNSDSCTEELQRGSLDDHLKYRCSGTLVACQYAGAGCDFRGPKKTMPKHQTDCKFQKEGRSQIEVTGGLNCELG